MVLPHDQLMSISNINTFVINLDSHVLTQEGYLGLQRTS